MAHAAPSGDLPEPELQALETEPLQQIDAPAKQQQVKAEDQQQKQPWYVWPMLALSLVAISSAGQHMCAQDGNKHSASCPAS